MSFPRYERYKESGVEWLGEVPEGWEVKRLKRNFRLLTEKTDRREHPVALENIESWSGRFIETETEFQGEGVAFNAGDVLFGKLRPYLAKALLVDQSGEAVGDFHVMRPSSDVAGRFALYQILNQDFISIVDGSTFGAKMPRVSWDFMANLMQAIPPLPEQQSIAAFLDRETGKIDELVAEQERLIALLKEKRQATISHAVTKGLNPDAPMKDSGIEWLGEVPVGWEVAPLKRHFSIAGGSTPKSDKEAYWDGQIVWVTPSDLSKLQSLYINDSQRKITYEGFSSCGTSLVPTNSIILSTRAPIGSLAISRTEVCTNQGCKALVPDNSADAKFYGYLLSNSSTELNIRGKGTTFLELSGDELGAFKVPFPPLPEQLTIAAFLDREIGKIDDMIQAVIGQFFGQTSDGKSLVGLLKERRSALISAAVTGKIDVRGWGL